MTLLKPVYAAVGHSDPFEIIKMNDHGEFITTILVNNRSVKAIVDTGANAVALSSVAADRLGINYKNAPFAQVHTAAGIAKGYHVRIENITIADVKIQDIQAVVIEGKWPTNVLLGMSYLQHFEMRYQGRILMLYATNNEKYYYASPRSKNPSPSYYNRQKPQKKSIYGY